MASVDEIFKVCRYVLFQLKDALLTLHPRALVTLANASFNQTTTQVCLNSSVASLLV